MSYAFNTASSLFASSSRMPRFGAGSRVYRSSAAEGLTDEQVRTVAPSVFAENKHSSRSARYSYIPTSEILAGLRKEGFVPMEIRQAGSRVEGKEDFTKHMLRLRHASAPKLGDSLPEIILVNSHDGTSSYQLMLGMFRLVCSNGLIVSEGTHAAVRVSHTGDARSQVIDGCVQILDAAPRAAESAQAFQALTLTEAEQMAFARAAHVLRYPDASPEHPSAITPAKLLEPARRADTGSDLWSTFNRVQENTVRGGQSVLTRNAAGQRRRVTTREIQSIDGNVSLNRALWTLAEEMERLKA